MNQDRTQAKFGSLIASMTDTENPAQPGPSAPVSVWQLIILPQACDMDRDDWMDAAISTNPVYATREGAMAGALLEANNEREGQSEGADPEDCLPPLTHLRWVQPEGDYAEDEDTGLTFAIYECPLL